MNARFKVRGRRGGEVTLTLGDGESLSWGHFERTDEGWESTGYTWSLHGGDLIMEVTTDGTDCDGRLTRYNDFTARLEEIDCDRWPRWTVINSSQRDYAAEAAGY